jgi:hypothetical protein
VKAGEWSEGWTAWVIGCFLLGKRSRSALWLGHVQGYGNWSYTPELSAPVGSPLGAFTETPAGALLRNFTTSVVVVNPTGGWPTPSDGETLRVALAGGSYTDLHGRTPAGLGADGVLTLFPQTAAVLLLKAGSVR